MLLVAKVVPYMLVVLFNPVKVVNVNRNSHMGQRWVVQCDGQHQLMMYMTSIVRDASNAFQFQPTHVQHQFHCYLMRLACNKRGAFGLVFLTTFPLAVLQITHIISVIETISSKMKTIRSIKPTMRSRNVYTFFCIGVLGNLQLTKSITSFPMQQYSYNVSIQQINNKPIY